MHPHRRRKPGCPVRVQSHAEEQANPRPGGVCGGAGCAQGRARTQKSRVVSWPRLRGSVLRGSALHRIDARIGNAFKLHEVECRRRPCEGQRPERWRNAGTARRQTKHPGRLESCPEPVHAFASEACAPLHFDGDRFAAVCKHEVHFVFSAALSLFLPCIVGRTGNSCIHRHGEKLLECILLDSLAAQGPAGHALCCKATRRKYSWRQVKNTPLLTSFPGGLPLALSRPRTLGNALPRTSRHVPVAERGNALEEPEGLREQQGDRGPAVAAWRRWRSDY